MTPAPLAQSYLDVARLVEPIHLVQQLEEDALDLTVCAGLRVESLGRDRVDLVDEDDRRRILTCEPEHVADHAWALAQVLLHELGAVHADERGGRVMCDGLHEHGLASS
jgi:hypothetical protein